VQLDVKVYFPFNMKREELSKATGGVA